MAARERQAGTGDRDVERAVHPSMLCTDRGRLAHQSVTAPSERAPVERETESDNRRCDEHRDDEHTGSICIARSVDSRTRAPRGDGRKHVRRLDDISVYGWVVDVQ